MANRWDAAPVEVVRRDLIDFHPDVPLCTFCRVTILLAVLPPCRSVTVVAAVIAVPADAIVGMDRVALNGTMGEVQFAMVRVAPVASAASALMLSFLDAAMKVRQPD